MTKIPGEGEPGGPVLRSWDSVKAAEVGARFILNELAGHGAVIDQFFFECMDMEGNETVADIGTRDGAFPDLIVARGHKGKVYGIDIDDNDFIKYPDPYQKNLVKVVEEIIGEEAMQHIDLAFPENTNQPVLLKGDANNLPFKNKSVDRLTVRKMLYHMTEEQQREVFEEFLRVLVDDGMILPSTSGAENKYVHRRLEEDISAFLDRYYPGIEPPLHMNKGFTTQIAGPALMSAFDPHGFNVYKREFVSILPIKTEGDTELYVGSQRSMRREFDPVPDEELFELALDLCVRKKIQENIRRDGQFSDFISESVFVVTKRRIDAKKLELQKQ